MEFTKKVDVTNRSNGYVFYSIPEMNIHREFFKKETKKIPYSEIDALSQQPGGRELIYNYLFIKDGDVLHDALNVNEEPEYWLTEEKIPTWINTCTIEEFKDALDFAPEGVIDLIKKYAVSVPLNASDKREAMLTQLKYDVTKAIEINKESEAAEDENSVPVGESATKRRSQPTYKVIEKKS